mmetsp:Transcript_46710/g.116393  ORF Transcript_46710/g.116393 Transcript_46710/m.116393 type:complete len:202 (+) Transcript_46710:450-1055(+)
MTRAVRGSTSTGRPTPLAASTSASTTTPHTSALANTTSTTTCTSTTSPSRATHPSLARRGAALGSPLTRRSGPSRGSTASGSNSSRPSIPRLCSSPRLSICQWARTPSTTRTVPGRRPSSRIRRWCVWVTRRCSATLATTPCTSTGWHSSPQRAPPAPRRAQTRSPSTRTTTAPAVFAAAARTSRPLTRTAAPTSCSLSAS